MCLTRVPLVPANRIDVRAHDAVQVDDRGVRTPRTAKVYVRQAGFTGQAAMIEDERGLLVFEVFTLCCNVTPGRVLVLWISQSLNTALPSP